MFNSKPIKFTDMARIFLQPKNSTHRQYEALRAFFVDKVPGREAAERFGYSEGSFRVMAARLRKNPEREFFLPPDKGPKKKMRKDTIRDTVVSMRKQNLSVYDISHILKEKGHTLSAVSVSNILKEEGFKRLPRRREDERTPATGPARAEVADVGRIYPPKVLGQNSGG